MVLIALAAALAVAKWQKLWPFAPKTPPAAAATQTAPAPAP